MQELLEPIICDNFFDDPDAVRQFALNAVNYYPASIHMTKGNWPGKRSYFLPWINNNIFNDFSSKLFDLLKLPIDTPVFFDVTFNYCTRQDPKGVVHKDRAWSKPDHVGVVYLTPDPPPDSGSILYSPTEQLLKSGSGPDYHDPNNHTIKARLDNAYNRLVLYDPREYHNADQYFGDSLDDSRLFIVFFMRLGNMDYSGIKQFEFPNSSPSLNISLPWFDSPNRKDLCTCGSGKRFKACCGDMSLQRQPPQDFLLFNEAFPVAEIRQMTTTALQNQSLQPLSDTRFGNVSKIDADANEQATLNRFFTTLCQQKIVPGIHCDIAWLEQPAIHYYTSGSGRALHADAEIYNAETGFAERVLNRDLSLLAFPQDLPAGVELIFPFFNYRIRPVAGDLLVFPSDQRFRYEITSLSVGDFCILLSWASKAGPAQIANLPAGAIAIRQN